MSGLLGDRILSCGGGNQLQVRVQGEKPGVGVHEVVVADEIPDVDSLMQFAGP
jgi:hypothetical protein